MNVDVNVDKNVDVNVDKNVDVNDDFVFDDFEVSTQFSFFLGAYERFRSLFSWGLRTFL